MAYGIIPHLSFLTEAIIEIKTFFLFFFTADLTVDGQRKEKNAFLLSQSEVAVGGGLVCWYFSFLLWHFISFCHRSMDTEVCFSAEHHFNESKVETASA